MKTLFIDCGMGAAGDMLTAALLELMPDKEEAVRELNALGIPAVKFEAESSVKCGITGTHMHVYINGEEEDEFMHDHHFDHDHEHHDHDHEHEHEHHHDHDHEHEHHHHHTGMHEIAHIVDHMKVSDSVKRNVLAVYNLIAEAESNAHGVPVTEIHFHEVGDLDAIADVTAVCYLMEKLGADKVLASPVHVGAGTVRCAHGVLPVPAPATAYMLREVPIYGGRIQSELCTPTGAALLKHFVSDFGNMPVMKVEKYGYGMGKKDFERANCVRVLLGSEESAEDTDVICELSCNLDDMTGEEIGYAMDKLYENGAREVFTVPVQTKKNRPAVVLKVLTDAGKKEKVLQTVFKYTTTIGIREAEMKRYILRRTSVDVETVYGTVRKKVSEGYGTTTEKYEYDDLKVIADREGLSIMEVKKNLK